MFSNHFDMMISKIIFKKYKIIIDIFFWVKNTLKNNHNHTLKYPLKQKLYDAPMTLPKSLVRSILAPTGPKNGR